MAAYVAVYQTSVAVAVRSSRLYIVDIAADIVYTEIRMATALQNRKGHHSFDHH